VNAVHHLVSRYIFPLDIAHVHNPTVIVNQVDVRVGIYSNEGPYSGTVSDFTDSEITHSADPGEPEQLSVATLVSEKAIRCGTVHTIGRYRHLQATVIRQMFAPASNGGILGQRNGKAIHDKKGKQPGGTEHMR
jgi:hypothetical protein